MTAAPHAARSFVIAASVAIKWVVQEAESAEAMALRRPGTEFLAPDLLAIECANILWKKARLGELTAEEAQLACAILGRADITLAPTRLLMERALGLALRLDHPAYDCAYLALAAERRLPLVTADRRLLRRVAAARAEGDDADWPEIHGLTP